MWQSFDSDGTDHDATMAGRAAYEYFRPLVLAERDAIPTDEEWIAVVGRGYDVIPLPEALRKCQQLFRNRILRLTAPEPKPDPAIDVVVANGDFSRESAKQLLAQIDAARAKKKA